ncbi:MFS transporter [Nonomuraea sp. NPDC049152]|uniref:MFS transporter n=1 Tax=Nonomuraea sp. NPDC049152 TaxID=3154350 RepID=UPI0033C81346
MGTRYWLLLVGFLVSSLGTWIYRLALPLMVLDLTGSALGTGLVYALEYLPYLALAMFGGVLADRHSRRSILVAGDLAAAVLALVLAVTVTLGAPPLWLIYVMAFLLACVDPLYQPAFRAIMPSLVPVDRLAPANARLHIGEHAVNLAGPVLGGALIVAFGYQVAIYVDAGTFAVSAALIALIRTAPAVARASRPVLADLREGLRFLFRQERTVLTLACFAFAGNFGVWLLLADMVFYLTSYHHFTPGQIGVVYAFQGAGAVAGGLLGSRLLSRTRPVTLISVSMLIEGVSILAMIPARGPLPIGLAWMGQFAAAGVGIVAITTVRQRLIPDHLLGRVLGTARMIAFLAIPLAALVAGVFESFVRNAYALMAFAGLASLAIAAAAARSSLRDVALEPVAP